MIDLKPCPFCGGEPQHNNGGNSVYGRLWWAVWCNECQIEVRDKEVWSDWTEPGAGRLKGNPKDCFKLWNNRHEGTQSDKLKERLRAIINWCDLAIKNKEEFDSHGVRLLDGPIFDEAREVLK